MKQTIFILMTLLLSCSNNVRLNTYQTLKEKTGIAEILQSDQDVKDAKDICAMAERELDLRLEYYQMIMQGKVEKDDIKVARYGEEIEGIVNSKLISEKYMEDIQKKYEGVFTPSFSN